jgi:Methyltransferase domain
MSLYKQLSRTGQSLSKRLFWREHLQQAISELQSLRKEMATTEMLVALPYLFRSKGYYRSLELKQNMVELLGLVRLIERQPLQTVCEIGTFRGGTLYLWCQLVQPNGSIFSIDLPGGAFGGGYNERSLPFFESFITPGQSLDCLRGNSHEASVRDDFAGRLAGRQLDFLFIDGDHSYQGVRQDYEDYSPFVKTGGVIGFHDIVQRATHPELEVWRFWQELKASQKVTHEFIETGNQRRRIGIGAVVKQ